MDVVVSATVSPPVAGAGSATGAESVDVAVVVADDDDVSAAGTFSVVVAAVAFSVVEEEPVFFAEGSSQAQNGIKLSIMPTSSNKLGKIQIPRGKITIVII